MQIVSPILSLYLTSPKICDSSVEVFVVLMGGGGGWYLAMLSPWFSPPPVVLNIISLIIQLLVAFKDCIQILELLKHTYLIRTKLQKFVKNYYPNSLDTTSFSSSEIKTTVNEK